MSRVGVTGGDGMRLRDGTGFGRLGKGRTAAILWTAAVLAAGGMSAAQGADLDGNGIDDGNEIDLAMKFRPSLVFPDGENSRMKPLPVTVLGRGSDGLTADLLWAAVYNAAGQVVTVARTTDPGWNPAPSFSSPLFDYSGFGWDGNAITYVGAPPGAAYYIYYVRLYPDYGGPGVDCPAEWEDLLANGSSAHPPADSLDATTYVHLFRSGGDVVIQYWFFYPYNNWVNNHEGDWEHLNVKVSSDDPQTAEIVSCAFYFHLHYTERDTSSMIIADGTHPVVWVGGTSDWACDLCDATGCGGDVHGGAGGHGNYPAPGTWTDVGPDIPGCGAPDEIVERCGRWLHWGDLAVEILPEPETIDFAAEPGRAWAGANIPFGTLFVPTYCGRTCEFFDSFPVTAWLIDDCGNAAPGGPCFNDGWDRFTGGGDFTPYAGASPERPAPEVLTVPEPFPGIAWAAACALPGDTVLVSPGSYRGGVKIRGGVTFLSTGGADSTFWTALPLSYGARLLHGTTGVTIGAPGRGFEFTWKVPFLMPLYNLKVAPHGVNRVAGCRFTSMNLWDEAIVIPSGDASTTISNSFFISKAVGGDLAADARLTLGGSLDEANDFVASSSPLSLTCNGCPTVQAEFNYWGTIDGEEIASKIGAAGEFVDYEPWTDGGHSLKYGPTVGIPSAAGEEEGWSLSSTGPMPASSGVNVSFHLPRPAAVRWTLFDVRGREVGRRTEGRLPGGNHSLRIAMDDMAPGIYFVRLEAPPYRQTIRVVLVK